MRRVLCILLAAVAAVALVAAPAEAERRPTPEERASVAEAAGVPARCVRIRISTVNRRWALAVLNSRCEAANGAAAFERERGEWRRRYYGPYDAGPCRVLRRVPSRVALDLGLCYRP